MLRTHKRKEVAALSHSSGREKFYDRYFYILVKTVTFPKSAYPNAKYFPSCSSSSYDHKITTLHFCQWLHPISGG